MSALSDRLAGQANPANAPEKGTGARERIPMSMPVQKLSVPEIPGWHCHWMLGNPARLQQAMRAGYVFVEQDEVDLNNVGIGNGPEGNGSTDLGTRVTVTAGGVDDRNQANTLVLMKLPQELWEQDQAGLLQRNEQTAAAIRGDFKDPSGDNSNRYTKHSQKNLFQPKTSRRP